MRNSFALLWPAMALCAPTFVGEAAPPAGSKPLTEILRPLEAGPIKPISKKSSWKEANTRFNILKRMGLDRKLRLIRSPGRQVNLPQGASDRPRLQSST